jgi:hypothetical protein
MAYQMMKGKKDNNDGFPSIPGTIARYSASGLTNEQMAANPVWVDKTGNGHDIQLKNFSWKGMSGVGGYVTNKDIYEYDLDRYSYTFIENSTKVHDFYIVFELIGYDENFKDGFNLDVRSISQGLKYRKTYTKNGIYIFQYKDEEGLDDLFAIGYNGNGGARSNFTVKILPLYPGFILSDGVDDFAVTEKELNFEGTYTVYTPLILLKYGGVVSGKSSAKDFSLNTVVSLKSIGFNSANAWSGSIPVDLFEFALVVCKRDPKTMYVKDLITGKANQSNSKEFVPNPGKYFIWRNTGGSWCQVAIAGQIICNGHFSTDEEDAKVLAWHKKQYPWLFPDQAWTVVGKTNEDEDRATIANITGNGNNLVLSNFGFAEGSGYNEEGEYAGYLVTDGVDDKVQSSSFTMNEDWTIVGDWELLSNVQINCGIVKAQNVYLYNIANGLLISINNPRSLQSFGTKSLHAICSDGRLYDRNWVEYEYTVDQNFAIVESSLNIGFNLNNYTQIAFKNLGIYNNQILSKEDCIKAYNYLQTLKAK